jgi:hypothetical protein
MALDVYFREDILNVLRSAYVASEGSASLVTQVLQDPELRNIPVQKLLSIYRQGFVTALGSVGIAFGLEAIPEGRARYVTHSLEPASGTEPVSMNTAVPASASGDWDGSLDEEPFGFLWPSVQHKPERR